MEASLDETIRSDARSRRRSRLSKSLTMTSLEKREAMPSPTHSKGFSTGQKSALASPICSPRSSKRMTFSSMGSTNSSCQSTRSVRSSTGNSTSSSFSTIYSSQEPNNDSVYAYTSDLCEHTCNNCQDRQTARMCVECKLFMCSQCMQDHVTRTRGHMAIEVSCRSNILTIPNSNGDSCSVCTCNDDSESVDSYCTNHFTFCCRQCKMLNHRDCITEPLENLLIDLPHLKSSTSKCLKELLYGCMIYMKENDSSKIKEHRTRLAKQSKKQTLELIKAIKGAHTEFIKELDEVVGANLEMVELCKGTINDINLHIQAIEQPKSQSDPRQNQLKQLNLLKTIQSKHLNDYKRDTKTVEGSNRFVEMKFHPNKELFDYVKQESIGHLCKWNKTTHICSFGVKVSDASNEIKNESKSLSEESYQSKQPNSTLDLIKDPVGADLVTQAPADNANQAYCNGNGGSDVFTNKTGHFPVKTDNFARVSDEHTELSSLETGGVDIVLDVANNTNPLSTNANDLTTAPGDYTGMVVGVRKVQVSHNDCEYIKCWSEGDPGNKTCITDIKRVNSDTVLIADNDNKKLKLLRRRGTSAGSIFFEKLNGEPWQIAEYDKDKFLVTVLEGEQHVCLIIEILGLYISVYKSFPLRKECTGIAVNGNDVIFCGYDGEHAYIIVTDLAGELRSEVNYFGKTGLARPNYLCISDDASLLYVSDVDRGVFGLRMKDLNEIVFCFREGITCPMGMTVDSNSGDLIVCAAQSHALYRLSRDGNLIAVYTVKNKQFQFQTVCLFEGGYVIASADNSDYALIKIPICD